MTGIEERRLKALKLAMKHHGWGEGFKEQADIFDDWLSGKEHPGKNTWRFIRNAAIGLLAAYATYTILKAAKRQART